MAFLRSLRVNGEALKNCCPAGLLEGTCLVRDVLFVQPLLFFKDLLLGGFEHGIEPADDGHGKYHVAVLAPDKEVRRTLSAMFQMKLEMVASWLSCNAVSSLRLVPIRTNSDGLGDHTPFFDYCARDSVCDTIWQVRSTSGLVSRY